MVDYDHKFAVRRKQDENDKNTYYINIILQNKDEADMRINHFVVYMHRKDQKFELYNIREDKQYKKEIDQQEYATLKPEEKISKDMTIRSRGKPKFSHRLDLV